MNKEKQAQGHWITRKSDVLGGKPIIRGTRVSVEVIVSYVVNARTAKDSLSLIKRDYPSLNNQQIEAAMSYSRASIGQVGDNLAHFSNP